MKKAMHFVLDEEEIIELIRLTLLLQTAAPHWRRCYETTSHLLLGRRHSAKTTRGVDNR